MPPNSLLILSPLRSANVGPGRGIDEEVGAMSMGRRKRR